MSAIPGYLQARDLAYIRRSLVGRRKGVLPDTCLLYTKDNVQSATGSIVEGYTLAYSNVACRLDNLSTRYRDERIRGADRTIAIPEFVMWFEYNQTVNVQMHVVHGGFTYEVERTLSEHSWAGLKSMHIRRLD